MWKTRKTKQKVSYFSPNTVTFTDVQDDKLKNTYWSLQKAFISRFLNFSCYLHIWILHFQIFLSQGSILASICITAILKFLETTECRYPSHKMTLCFPQNSFLYNKKVLRFCSLPQLFLLPFHIHILFYPRRCLWLTCFLHPEDRRDQWASCWLSECRPHYQYSQYCAKWSLHSYIPPV